MFVNDLIPLIDKTFRTYSDEEQKETILMKKVIFLVSIFMIVAAGFVIAQQPAPVKVEEGLLQGTSEDGLTIYRGIPFATPPVGDLRWRAPQPAAKWDGVKLATKFASGPTAADSTEGPRPNRFTAGRDSPRRVWFWSASPIVLDSLDSWLIRS
jgi:hypothetical protein